MKSSIPSKRSHGKKSSKSLANSSKPTWSPPPYSARSTASRSTAPAWPAKVSSSRLSAYASYSHPCPRRRGSSGRYRFLTQDGKLPVSAAVHRFWLLHSLHSPCSSGPMGAHASINDLHHLCWVRRCWICLLALFPQTESSPAPGRSTPSGGVRFVLGPLAPTCHRLLPLAAPITQ